MKPTIPGIWLYAPSGEFPNHDDGTDTTNYDHDRPHELGYADPDIRSLQSYCIVSRRVSKRATSPLPLLTFEKAIAFTSAAPPMTIEIPP